MSTPSFLALPPGARRVQLSTARGPVTGLRHDAIGPRQGSVLLVPGWTGSKEDFLAVLEPLARLGWDVVTYDQRGQYETTGPDEESAYTLTALGTDLLDLVASLQPVHVVGHSFGGLVSREAALMSGGDGFASLTLLCSGPASIPGEQQAALEAMYQAQIGRASCRERV